MFDFGFGELLLAAVVALVVLGPERLPGAARTAGRMLRKLRQSWSNVRDEVQREMQAEDLKRQMNDAVMKGRSAAEDLSAEARRHLDDITRGVRPESSEPDADDSVEPASDSRRREGRDDAP
ncbi:MAG: Sec-independent protein translocase protein TatB [Rhodanobacteraceae bacterium]